MGTLRTTNEVLAHESETDIQRLAIPPHLQRQTAAGQPLRSADRPPHHAKRNHHHDPARCILQRHQERHQLPHRRPRHHPHGTPKLVEPQYALAHALVHRETLQPPDRLTGSHLPFTHHQDSRSRVLRILQRSTGRTRASKAPSPRRLLPSDRHPGSRRRLLQHQLLPRQQAPGILLRTALLQHIRTESPRRRPRGTRAQNRNQAGHHLL